MPSGVGMFAGVFVRRAVTATRPSALLAGAKVNPPRSNLDAVLALLAFRMHDVVDALDVLTGTSG